MKHSLFFSLINILGLILAIKLVKLGPETIEGFC
jgi:hypothetical protein